jgi:hypothetical protein
MMDATSQDEAAIAALQSRIAALAAAGNHAEAIPLAERWAEAAKARFGERHAAFAAALVALGELLHRAGRLDEAEAVLSAALAIYDSLDNQELREKTFGSLAQVLTDAGRTDEIRPFYAGHGTEVSLPSPEDAAALPPSPVPAPAPARAPEAPRPAAARLREEAPADRRVGPILREKVDARRALEIDAGRLAYQIPQRMWLNQPETVEVRLGRTLARGLTRGFGGRGEVKTEDIPIVETMSVTLLCEPGAFDIQARSDRDQLVKPDLVLGTALHGDDFGRWVWLVMPRRRGEHTLLVKVSAAIRDSRGLPTTSSLPDMTFAVSVRVRILRAVFAAIVGAVPGLVWVAITTVAGSVVGILTKDYWWPALRRLLGWE